MEMTTAPKNRMNDELLKSHRRVPSEVYLTSSIVAMIASFLMKKRGHVLSSIILQWSIPVVLIALYNKILASKDPVRQINH